MNRLRAIKRNTQISQHAKISPVVLALSEANKQRDKTMNAVLAVAMGALLPYTEKRSTGLPWITPLGMTEIARKLAETQTSAAMTVDDIEVIRFSTVVPTWNVLQQDNLANCQEAQGYIERVIKAYPPSDNEINTVLTFIKNLATQDWENPTQLSQEELQERLLAYEIDAQWPMMTALQKFHLMQYNIHHFPVMLATDDAGNRAVLLELITPSSTPTDPTTVQFLISTTAKDDWKSSNITTIQRLVFYEILAVARIEESRTWLASAALLYIAALCKGSNVTNAWLTSRCERLETETGSTNLMTHLSPDIVRRFIEMNPRSKASIDNLYDMIAAAYTIFGDSGIKSLNWIMEQSAAHNVASAIALAQCVTKIKGFDIDYLMSQLPYNEFKAISELAGHLIYDKFCSLVEPPVEMHNYADLAYIGTYIEFFQCNPGKTRNDYRGTPLAHATLTQVQLDNIANNIMTAAREFINEQASPVHRLKALFTGFNVAEVNDDIYIYTDREDIDLPSVEVLRDRQNEMSGYNIDNHNANAAQVRAAPAEPTPLGIDLPPRRANDAGNDEGNQNQEGRDNEGARQATRADWARNMRHLPRRAVRLTTDKIVSILKQTASRRSLAFQNIMAELCSVSVQRRIDPIKAGDINNTFQRCSKLDEGIIRSLEAMDVAILPKWRIDPPALPAIHETHNSGETVILYYRPIDQKAVQSSTSPSTSGPQAVPTSPISKVPAGTKPPQIKPLRPDDNLMKKDQKDPPDEINKILERYKNPTPDADGRVHLPPTQPRKSILYSMGYDNYKSPFDYAPLKEAQTFLDYYKFSVPASGWDIRDLLVLPQTWLTKEEYKIVYALMNKIKQDYSYPDDVKSSWLRLTLLTNPLYWDRIDWKQVDATQTKPNDFASLLISIVDKVQQGG